MGPLRHTTVLFVSSRTGHTLSRVERRWLPLMRALLAAEVNVVLVATPRGPLVAPARALGVTVASYRVDRLNILVTRNRLRALLERERPTVAFASGYHADVPLRLAARGLPVKVVSTVHCGSFTGHGIGALVAWGRNHMEQRTAGRVDAVLADCAGVTDLLVARGIAPERVHVVAPGVDIGEVAREAASAGPASDVRPRVGYAGALEPGRGLPTLATAAALIRERHPAVRVIVAGEGPARLSIVPAALDGRIELVGRVPSVPAVLAALDVCVFPSADPGIPTSLLEAAALGRPIVACDVPGVSEMFADGREIVLVPRGDARALAHAVSALLDDPARARALGQAARVRVIDEYSEAEMVARLVSLVRRLSA